MEELPDSQLQGADLKEADFKALELDCQSRRGVGVFRQPQAAEVEEEAFTCQREEAAFKDTAEAFEEPGEALRIRHEAAARYVVCRIYFCAKHSYSFRKIYLSISRTAVSIQN